MATIKDVARLAGVSVGTVSHVLNRPERVNPATASAVREAIASLNYYPNRIARSLVTARSQMVGLVVSNIHNVIYSQIAKAVEGEMIRANYNVMLLNTDYRREKEVAAVDFLLEANVVGVILGSTYEEGNYNHLQKLIDHGIPVVVINRNLNEDIFYQIIYNTVRGSFHATKHLLELGHRRIGFIGGTVNKENAHDVSANRYKGFLQALDEAGLSSLPGTVLMGDDITYEEGYRLAKEMAGSAALMPSALFVSQDDMAIGAMQALAHLGMRVPGDVSVVGFANHFYSRYAVPPLTTVNVPSSDCGKLAAEILLKIFAGEKVPRQTIYVPCDLVVRESTRQFQEQIRLR